MKIFWRGIAGLVLVLLVPALLLGDQAPDAEKRLWTRAETALALGLLGGAGVVSLFDEDIRREVQRRERNTLDEAADGLNLLGHPAMGLGLSAILWGAGVWREDRPLAETGQLAFEAVFLGQLATAALKVGAGRKRPDEREDAWSFRPFSLDKDYDALPSGHTANAFALAGVLSRRGEQPWLPWVCYGFAGLVGGARLQADDHWASDVLVGALAGEIAARLVLRFHERHPEYFLGIGAMGDGGTGVQFSWRW